MSFIQIKKRILDYLEESKQLELLDIQNHENLSESEKMEQGFMIKDALVVDTDNKGACRL